MKATLIAIALTLSTMTAAAKDLPGADANTIKAGGVPIFDQAVFLDGSKEAGYRFVTNKSIDGVRQWYRGKLADWSLFTDYGQWLIYKGKKGAGAAEIMEYTHVSVGQMDPELMKMYKLSKDMSTDIVIVIPK